MNTSLLYVFFYNTASGSLNYVLTADPGGYAYSGAAANFSSVYRVTADAATFTYTGSAATTRAAFGLVADPGAYTYAGVAATLTYQAGASQQNYTLVADAGSFAYAGAPANFGVPDAARSKGGFDPFYFKRRNKRRTPEDVRQFADLVAQADLSTAPEPVRVQAEDAREAALAALQTQARADLEAALTEIRIFYALLRAETRARRQAVEAQRRLEADEDEDDEILLLAA